MNELLVDEKPITLSVKSIKDLGLTDSLVFNFIKEHKTIDIKVICKELTFFSESTIKRSIVKLRDSGYIQEKFYKAEELKSLVLNESKYKNKICEWCKSTTIVLHEHHYPIPKRLGGTETVSICPNCHYGYHNLEKGELI